MRSAPVLLVGLLLAVGSPACSRPGTPPAVPPLEPVGGPAFEPDPTGPLVNATPEEEAAWRDIEGGGVAVVETSDAKTREPIAYCDFYAFKHALTAERVDRRLSPRVSKPRRAEDPDGIHRYRLGRGFYRLRLTSDGYRNTWTPIFEIRPGEETRLAMLMERANLLRVTVLDENGAPIESGGVGLRAPPRFRAALHITNGAGEQLVDVDELTVEVGRIWLTEYVPQEIPVRLEPGGVTEIAIRLVRK